MTDKPKDLLPARSQTGSGSSESESFSPAVRFGNSVRQERNTSKNPAAVALGKMKSDKKAASSRRNGKLGGRPAKAKRERA